MKTLQVISRETSKNNSRCALLGSVSPEGELSKFQMSSKQCKEYFKTIIDKDVWLNIDHSLNLSFDIFTSSNTPIIQIHMNNSLKNSLETESVFESGDFSTRQCLEAIEIIYTESNEFEVANKLSKIATKIMKF